MTEQVAGSSPNSPGERQLERFERDPNLGPDKFPLYRWDLNIVLLF